MNHVHRCALLAALLLGPLTATSALAADAPAAMDYQGPSFKRATLLVADIDRSLAIYRDILGFQGGEVNNSLPTSYSYEVFNLDPKATLRTSMLSAGPNQVRTLALFEIKGQPITTPQSPRPVAMVINAVNLPAVMEKIKAKGLTTIAPRPLKTPEGRTGTETAFIDPDGHLVVLYELTGP
ncbi:VOC family protein [Niveispirillum cyanobacteriorum]|nr:VOC family protein [Niveispirillum cyanobacteriorum]GGE86493.1 hypothetical protein GCM10011317_49570 [Niveispirillum cyanobacteriorum]